MSSSDSDDEVGPPPCRQDTGLFERPSQLEVSPTFQSQADSPANSPSNSPASHSSFRWDRAQSFRLYAVNSRSLLRRNTSFGLGASLNGSDSQLGSHSPMTPMGGATSDDPKAICKQCYQTLKSHILATGDLTTEGGSSTLPSSLHRGPQIGSGGYATVYCGVNLSSGELIAIKEIQISGTRSTNPEAFRSVEEEFALLRRLKHRNVIQYLLFEYSLSQEICRIVMEFCAGGSSLQMLQKFGPIPESMLKHIAAQLFAGLEFIHKEGIIHRDIKPANILMHANGTVKLADFGCSRRINELSSTSNHVLGTPIYMAPEYIKGQTHRKSDVWAVGCTLLELATGKAPWHHTRLRDNLSLMFHISTTFEGPQIPWADVSNDFADFLGRCFDREVGRRPEASELLTHAWLSTPSEEDSEGLLAIEEIGADQFSVLVEQLCQTESPIAPPEAVILSTPSGERITSNVGSRRESQVIPPGEEMLALPSLGSGLAAATVFSQDASRITSPVDEPLEVPFENISGSFGLESRDDEEPKRPEGTVHMEVPIEACGRSMRLGLEVKAEDLQLKVLAGRRKSFVVNITDGVREQIHNALQREAALTQEEVLSSNTSASSTPRASVSMPTEFDNF